MTQEDPQILLVEYDPKDVKLTLHALSEENLANTIQVARDGEEALDFLFCRGEFASRRFDHPPRLVLLDLKLPKVDGLDIVRAMKGDPRTQAIPVVVLTSSNEESDLVRSYQLGANAYIQKPLDFDSFRQTVKQLGLFWLVVNAPPPPSAFTPERTLR
jgi:CheY-like chemotaxis protein